MMIAIVRLKGRIKARKDATMALEVMGLKKPNSAILMENSSTAMGMIKKVNEYVAWGEADDDLKEKIKGVAHLKPPVKGLKNVRTVYPHGDLGYRGRKINELLKRML